MQHTASYIAPALLRSRPMAAIPTARMEGSATCPQGWWGPPDDFVEVVSAIIPCRAYVWDVQAAAGTGVYL